MGSRVIKKLFSKSKFTESSADSNARMSNYCKPYGKYEKVKISTLQSRFQMMVCEPCGKKVQICTDIKPSPTQIYQSNEPPLICHCADADDLQEPDSKSNDKDDEEKDETQDNVSQQQTKGDEHNCLCPAEPPKPTCKCSTTSMSRTPSVRTPCCCRT